MKRKTRPAGLLGQALKDVTRTRKFRTALKAQYKSQASIKKQKQGFWKLEIKGKGYARVWMPKGYPGAELTRMDVKKKLRRLRIGRALLEAAEEFASKKGAAYMEIHALPYPYKDTPHPYAFYLKQGYSIHPLYHTPTEVPKLVQEKEFVHMVKYFCGEKEKRKLVREWTEDRRKKARKRGKK